MLALCGSLTGMTSLGPVVQTGQGQAWHRGAGRNWHCQREKPLSRALRSGQLSLQLSMS